MTNKLEDVDRFEDRTVPALLSPVLAVPEYSGAAEVLHVSPAQGLRQYARRERRYFHFSVIVVDFLLEHEWYWLLTGQHRTPARDWRPHDEWQETTNLMVRDNRHAEDDSSRTVCGGDSDWTIRHSE
jgi:hypothetical protein